MASGGVHWKKEVQRSYSFITNLIKTKPQEASALCREFFQELGPQMLTVGPTLADDCKLRMP